MPQPAVVTGVQGGEQIGHLGAAHLADHDPVGAHPERLPDQVAQGHLPDALDVRWTGEQPHHVRVRGRELGRVLAHHHPVGGVALAQQRGQQGGLPRAGAAGQPRSRLSQMANPSRAPCSVARQQCTSQPATPAGVPEAKPASACA